MTVTKPMIKGRTKSLIWVALVAGFFCGNTLAQTNGDPSTEAISKNWPAFRGPGGLGKASQSQAPLTWNQTPGENILWKTRIPKPGFSSPIIWDHYIFLSGSDEENQVVYCFDTETGNIVWESQVNDIPGSPAEPPAARETGLAAPTMTTDGQRVAAIFGSGDLVCLDFEGSRVWAKNIGPPDNHYGHSSSLLSYGDLLMVQYDHNASQHLLAFRFDTGKLIYDTAREIKISWASPILIDTGNRTELILSSNPFVVSYDPQTGNELWRVECMAGEVAPSPAYAAGRVFVVNEYARLAAIRIGNPPALIWESYDDLSEVASLWRQKSLSSYRPTLAPCRVSMPGAGKSTGYTILTMASTHRLSW
jgi:outer membrane protein assembly factor BamB